MLEKFDIFGQNFQLNIQNDSPLKKTKPGSLISLSVIGLSLAYFLFLIIQFSTGQTPPNISLYEKQNIGPHYFLSDNYSFFHVTFNYDTKTFPDLKLEEYFSFFYIDMKGDDNKEKYGYLDKCRTLYPETYSD